MTALRIFLRRVAGLFRRGRRDHQLNEEIQAHLDQLAEEFVRRGLSRRDASAAARRAFGGVEQVKEAYRDQRGFPIVDAVGQDVRLALRSFRRAPGSSLAAMVILALGTGLNTAVFAVVYGSLLRPLPYADPSRLVQLARQGTPARDLMASLSWFDGWRARFRLLDVAGYDSAAYTLRGVGDPRVIRAALVTDHFFDVLGATPLRGQPFSGSSMPSVVLSAGLAAGLTANSGGTLPPSLRIGPNDYAVSAVMPEMVTFPDHVDAWLPIKAVPAIQIFGRPQQQIVRMVARPHTGVTVAQARADIRRVFDDIVREEPMFSRIVSGATVVPLVEQLTGQSRPVLILFSAAAALVLFIACANVASVLIARAILREHEVAVRLALGAHRRHILRTYLVEGVLLALAGSIVGVLLAYVGVHALVAFAPDMLPRLDAIKVDGPVLIASLTIAALVAILCALAPGLHALRTEVSPVFRQTRTASPRTARRVTNVLVVVQIATSIVLLTGAGLLVRTIIELLRSDIGIETDGAVAVELMLAETTGQRAAPRKAFVQDLLAEVRAIPGVRDAGVGSSLPATGSFSMSMSFTDADDNGRTTVHSMMDVVAVTPGYFGALGTRLLRGRLFDEHDATGAVAVAVVSSAVGRDLFQDRDPVGRELPIAVPGGRPERPLVIGVVGDVRSGPGGPSNTTVYVPWNHLPAGDVHLIVRSDGDPLVMVPAIRQIIRRLDPGQPIGTAQSLEAAVSHSVANRQLYALLAGSFALLALTIALIGLAATLSRAVAERRRELAIRLALGASPRRTVQLVMRGGALLGLVGLVLGAAAAVAATRGLAALLYGVRLGDPFTYLTVTATVVVTVLVACYVPARRAARIDPSELLRAE